MHIFHPGTPNSIKQGVRSHVLEFLARTLLTCNILSFIIESEVLCLAIFIYMFSFCINKTMIYFKIFTFSLLRSRASKFFVRTSEFSGALALQDKFVWKKISSPAVNQYLVHILSPVTDNCSSWKSRRRNESMLPDRVSNPGPLTYESGALPIALRGPAIT